MDLVIGIAYGDDIATGIETLSKLMAEDDRVLQDPAPQCMVTNLGESSVDITMRFWANSDVFWPLKFDMTRRAKEAVEAAGLSIPFPQRDIHMLQAPEA